MRFSWSHRAIQAVAAVLLLAATGVAEHVRLPATPAGKKFGAFIRAFNSGDKDEMLRFIADNYSRAALAERPPEVRVTWYEYEYRSSQGFDLVRLEKADEHEIIVLARSRDLQDWARLSLLLEDDPSKGVKGVGWGFAAPPDDAFPRGRLTDAQVTRQLEAYVQHLVNRNLFSGVVLVAKGTQPIFEKAYGTYGDSHKPIPADGRFYLGSIGKVFTSVAIAQLVDAGKVRFDDPVSKFFPEITGDLARRITVHELLTHTAGLAALLDPKWFQEHRVRSEQDFAPLVLKEPLVADPGTRFSYSNGGYMILAGIVERATGQVYADYVRKHVLEPAGIVAPELAMMSAEDLWRFATALRSGKLLRPETRDLVLAPKVPTDAPGLQYAYGFFVEDVNGERLCWHDGNGPDTDDRFDMYQTSGYVVVVMCNQEGEAADRIGNRLRVWLTQK